MAKELSVLQQQAEAIKTEVNKGANTSSRIGGMFGDMLEYNEEQSKINEGNTGVSEYPEFSEQEEYKSGDVVGRNGKLYEFKVEHPAGSWNETHVEATSIKKIQDKKLTELGDILDIEKEFTIGEQNPKINLYGIPQGYFSFCLSTEIFKNLVVYVVYQDDTYDEVYNKSFNDKICDKIKLTYNAEKVFKLIRLYFGGSVTVNGSVSVKIGYGTLGANNLYNEINVSSLDKRIYGNTEIKKTFSVSPSQYPQINLYRSDNPILDSQQVSISYSNNSDLKNVIGKILLMNTNNVIYEIGSIINGELVYLDLKKYSKIDWNCIRLLWYKQIDVSNDVEISIKEIGDVIWLQDNVIGKSESYNLTVNASSYPQYNFYLSNYPILRNKIKMSWYQYSGNLVDREATIYLMNGNDIVVDLGTIKMDKEFSFNPSEYIDLVYNNIRFIWYGGQTLNNDNVVVSFKTIGHVENTNSSLNTNYNIAILADSISTYDKWVENSWYGPEGETSSEGANNVTSVTQTYWYKILKKLKASLVKNESWSGSTMSYSGWGNLGDNKENSFIQRMVKLGEQLVNSFSLSPNLIIIEGATNDSRPEEPFLGEYKYEGWVDFDFNYFRPACAYILYYLQYWNPGARIIFLIVKSTIKESVIESIKTICDHYGIEYVETYPSLSNGHPNIDGHNTMYEDLINKIVE